MPWVECADPQEMLDLTLMLTDPPIAHSGGAKLPKAALVIIRQVASSFRNQDSCVRLHRAWAVSLDQMDRDSDRNDRVDGTGEQLYHSYDVTGDHGSDGPRDFKPMSDP